MKKFTQLFLIGFTGLFLSFQANAQSGYYGRTWHFNSIGGVANEYGQAFTQLSTKTPDTGAKGEPLIFEGNPTKEQVHADFFANAQYGLGKFFRTDVSNTKITFLLDYGYTTDGDRRIFFDKIVASSGEIGNETNVQVLTRNEVRYDCNIVAQNCYVYQRYYYDFDRSEVYFNPENSYAKLLIFRYFKYNKVVKTVILPIVIEGTYTAYLGDSPGPMELVSILRKPPGDESYTSLKVSHEMTREISMSFSKTKSETSTESISASVGISKGPFSAGTEVSAERSKTFSETNGKEDTYSVTFTADEEFINESKSDLFIIKQYMYQYGFEIKVSTTNYNSEYLKVTASNRMLMYPLDQLVKSWTRTEEELLNTEIPKYVQSNELARVKYFQDIIDMNKRIKASAVTQIPDHSGPMHKTFTSSSSKSETITQEISLETSKSIKITDSGGIEIGPVEAGVEASAEKKWSVSTTTSNGNTSATINSKTVEFEIADSGLGNGDQLVTTIQEDQSFGTPVFLLNQEQSVTSCPYEGGFQLDNPEITVMDPITQQLVKSAKFSDIEEGQEVVFSLKLSNKNTKHKQPTKNFNS